ncbi:MAG TPA: glycosyltransferase [Candidatus Hydrogenedentes bacterium]|nr:glycosyltransferase [Candidatus Hydrogenedentota bacterium]HOL77724.1 glycosyltransferase [Candidatus Hydrogenedentota bacterium]HPO86847.1 glycosyltransferase [Candidatus Hydrogenedentota bacterium]
MSEPRLEIPPNLRRALDYKKFQGKTKLLILTTQYFFDESWKRAAEYLGWEVATVPSAMVGGLTKDQMRQLFLTLTEFRPDFLLTSNFAGMDVLGIFGRFFEDVRIPYVSWFTDTPRMILYERVVHCSHYTVAATWERAYEPHLRKLGFSHVFFMPHATDPFLFRGEFTPTPTRNVSFVGTSMIDQAREAWDVLSESPQLYREVEKAFLQDRVSRSIFPDGIEMVINPQILQKEEPRQRRHAELCLIYEGTRRLREKLVRALAPFNIEVRGDRFWLQIYSNVDGDVSYFGDLAEYYRTTAVNVNITSIQMSRAVNQRVFDCPAAGGFLLTDDQRDLYDFFDVGKEVIVYKDFEELAEKTQYYLKHPEERAQVVRAAQQRILKEHTHAHRLKSLETFLKDIYA